MKRKYFSFVLIGLFVLSFSAGTSAMERTGGVAQWNFDVYLNDRKVGKHLFTVSESAGVRQVRSEAKFTYRILLIPAYRYEHSAAERWSDECLVEISSRTDANGEQLEVSGEQTGTGFRVASDDGTMNLPECVMTFAYWNPEFLAQPRLLNPQTGEFVDVTVEKLGNESLKVRGQTVDATRFKLTAYKIDMSRRRSHYSLRVVLICVSKHAF
jgi:hypothetical protein